MAYNIPQLRQKSILDQYGMNYGDEGNIDLSGAFDDGSEQSILPSFDTRTQETDDPTNRSGPPSPVTPYHAPEMPHPAAPVDTTPKKTDYEQMMEIYNKMYTPQHTATDRLNALLDQFPDRSKSEPSWGRRLVAIGAGLSKGGMKAQEQILDAPYAEDLAAWKERAAPYQSAATLENQQNINERQLAASAAANTVAGRKADETQRTNQAKEDIARQKNEIAWAKQNGAKFYNRGSRVIAEFPDGTTIDGGPTTNWSPMELQALKNTGSLANTVQRGKDEITAAGVRGAFPLFDAQGNHVADWTPGGAGAGPTGGVRPAAGAPDKPTGPVFKPGAMSNAPIKPQTKADRAGLVNQIVNEDPSLAPYVKVGPNGDAQLTEPHATMFGGVSGALKAKFDAAKKRIYPETALPNAKSGTSVYIPTGGLVPDIGGEPPAGGKAAGGVDTGGQKQGEPWIQHSPSNPGVMRASIDGGKTWAYSNDGGKTWSKNEPPGGG